jgi:hypothetical protein
VRLQVAAVVVTEVAVVVVVEVMAVAVVVVVVEVVVVAPAVGVVGHHPHTPTSSNWVPLVLSPPCGCHCPPSRCQHVATLGVTFFFGPLISRV